MMLKTLLVAILCLTVVNTKFLQTITDIGLQFAEKLGQAVVGKLKLTDEVDYTFNYKQTIDKKTGYDYAFFLFGNKNAKADEGMQVMLHVSTALDGIAVPDMALDSNFNCTKPNGCITSGAAVACPAALTNLKLSYYDMDTNTILDTDFLSSTAQTCKTATTFMRWTNSTLEATETFDTNMNVNIFQVNNTNLAGAVGLLGLSPNSQFFSYISDKTEWNKNDDSMQFGLSYSPNSGASKLMDTPKEDIWKQNQFIIKGKRNGGDISFYSDLVSGAKTWTVGNAELLIDDTKSGYTADTNVQLCLSSNYPYMVGMTDATKSKMVLDYYNKVCGTNATDACPEKDAKKDQVKKARINLANKPDSTDDGYKHYSLTIETEDILFWNKDQFKPIVGQPITAEQLVALGCESTASIVVGRPFLSKYEAIMQINNKKDATSLHALAFVANEGTSSIFLIILIILGCIILAICIAIILLKVCKRKSNDEDGYNKQD